MLLAACTFAGCGSSETVLEWDRAQEMWNQRDDLAYQAWMELDEDSDEGKEARRRIAAADPHYKAGIDLIKDGDFESAIDKLWEGAEIAPIDPAYYVDIARVYSQRGFTNIAADYYMKAISSLPESDAAKVAREEYEALGIGSNPGLRSVFSPKSEISRYNSSEGGLGDSLGLFLAFAAGLLVAAGAFLAGWMRRSPGVSLSRLIDEAPEFHSAIAYLIGSVRHELLKHRMGAISDVIKTLRTGEGSASQLKFLRDRLYGGVPIWEAWSAQKNAFARALGSRLNLSKDAAFKTADQAFDRIADLQEEIAGGGPEVAARLVSAHERLREFDRHLAEQQTRLVRTRVDRELLEHVVEEVGGEYAVSSVRLDELAVVPVEAEIHIEVPREDLVLILKNLLRNAIMVVARDEGMRRVMFSVSLGLEPTGQEVVNIGLKDSGEAVLDVRDLSGSGKGTGLKLVSTAVRRYGGVMDVVGLKEPYRKEVIVRFFRVFEE